MFVAKDTAYRYYRIHPAIVQCYSDLVYSENKWGGMDQFYLFNERLINLWNMKVEQKVKYNIKF